MNLEAYRVERKSLGLIKGLILLVLVGAISGCDSTAPSNPSNTILEPTPRSGQGFIDPYPKNTLNPNGAGDNLQLELATPENAEDITIDFSTPTPFN